MNPRIIIWRCIVFCIWLQILAGITKAFSDYKESKRATKMRNELLSMPRQPKPEIGEVKGEALDKAIQNLMRKDLGENKGAIDAFEKLVSKWRLSNIDWWKNENTSPQHTKL